MNRIGLVLKPGHIHGRETLEKLSGWLVSLGKSVVVIDPFARNRKPRRVDMVVVLGGDGTLLSAARWVAGAGIPILAVNMGSLGFLTEITLEELYSDLSAVFKKEFLEDPRIMLECEILRGRKRIKKSTVLNDIVVNKGHFARLIRMEVSVAGQFVTGLRGDGLIVASSTGSTGYTLSAGGPIVHPSVDAIVLTPIAPHTLTNRPIVIPSDVEVRILLKENEASPVVTFDGQGAFPLAANDQVCIRVSKTRLKLIQSPNRNYYQVLREKLKWGEGTPRDS
ncbi:MAG: NAD(+)/NADH kinase [Nitrospirota bacterium]